MPIQILPKREGLAEILGAGLGQVGGGYISDYLRNKALEREQEQKKQIFQDLGIEPRLAELDPQSAALASRRLSEQDKEARQQMLQQQKEAEEQEKYQSAVAKVQDLYNVYNQTAGTDPYAPSALSSTAAKLYKDKAKTLRSDPIIKKLGITIPSIDSASHDVFSEAFGALGLQPQQAQPEVGQQQSMQLGQPQPQQPLQPGEYRRPEPTQQPSVMEAVKAMLSEGGAGVAGAPSRILDLIGSLQRGVASFTDQPTRPMEPIEEGMSRDDVIKRLSAGPQIDTSPSAQQQRTPSEAALESVKERIPTRESVSKYLGAPQKNESDAMKALRETAGDIGEDLAIGLPLGLMSGGLSSVGQALKLAGVTEGAGNLAKYMTKKLGFGEGAQETVKLGTSLLSGLGMGPSLKNIAKETYKKQLASLPENVGPKNRNVRDTLQDVAQYFSKPGSGYGAVNEKMTKMMMPNFSYKDALEFASEVRLKDIKNPTSAAYLKDYNNILKQSIKESKSIPKKSIDLLIDADSMWRGTKESEKAIEFIADIQRVGSLVKNGGPTGLAVLLASGSKIPALVGAGGLALAGANKMRVAMQQFATKPAIRNAYAKMMQAALEKSTPQVIRYATKLDKELRKQK